MDKYPLKGRAALNSPSSSYALWQRQPDLAALEQAADLPDKIPRQLQKESCVSIVTQNQSPDVPFDRSVNPYRGCEHGCIYCYARVSHAWLGLSPGLDFETNLFYKENAAEVLDQTLRRDSYQVQPITLGTNTDLYQPVERELKLTRSLLEVLLAHKHPLILLTKSSMVLRDMDLLREMAQQNLVQVLMSVTTMDRDLCRKMEPRASSPNKRLETIQTLTEAGISVGVMLSPVIPVLTDPEMESILKASHGAGANFATWSLLRLPRELADLFFDWLQHHYPDKAKHVENAIRGARQGRVNSPQFGQRQRGSGAYAHMIAQRFQLATRKCGFKTRQDPLNCELFHSSRSLRGQLSLF